MTGAIIIDAQLLVLLVVGSTDRAIIAKRKRTRQFLTDDFDLLLRLIGDRRLVLTPNAVTEASNHLMWHKQPERNRISLVLKRLVASHDESYVPSRTACDRDEYLRLGVADAAILVQAGDAVILTADLDLYVAAENARLSVVNFNHERERSAHL